MEWLDEALALDVTANCAGNPADEFAKAASDRVAGRQWWFEYPGNRKGCFLFGAPYPVSSVCEWVDENSVRVTKDGARETRYLLGDGTRFAGIRWVPRTAENLVLPLNASHVPVVRSLSYGCGCRTHRPDRNPRALIALRVQARLEGGSRGAAGIQ